MVGMMHCKKKSLMPGPDEGEGLEIAEYADVDGWGGDISSFAGIATSILVMLRMLDPAIVSTLRIIWDMGSSPTDIEHGSGCAVGDTAVARGSRGVSLLVIASARDCG